MYELKNLKSMLTAGRIGRRDFMMGALAMGATVSAASLMADKALAATPKKGGKLREAITGGASGDSLDPAQILDSYMIQVSFGMLRNCLTEIAADGSLIGELAESWDASDDATTWTFKIRKGVEFHNGKTLDATDVQESLLHHLGEDSKSAAKGIISNITEVKADGPDAVVFKLSGGSADFPFIMSDYHLGICPAKDGGGIDWESGIGTGGYSLDTFDPGVRTDLNRNPNYWKDGAAFFDEIEVLFIPDVTARTAALQTGEVDVMANADLKTIHLLKRSPNVQVIQTNGNKQITLPMDTRNAPFDSNDVRLALKYSIDREELLQKIFKGFGEVGNDHPIGPANVYQAKDIEQNSFDPDKAKHHLKKAGMENLEVTLHVADTAFEGAVDAGQLYQESAKKAGITLDIVREPNDGYWSNVWMKKPWVASYWGGRPTEDWMFSQVWSADAEWNESFWQNERFNELLIQGRAELDPDKRRDIYREMQIIARDDGGSIVPAFVAYVQAASDKIGLPEQLAGNWELDGHKNAERWWFN